ncbi:SDR family oxidoreductase [Aestuariirhabdus sp. Z084]|uniref:SDR family oxidoreductase n=1 Tax=Aestuariirhabdus haliotis TaxID=2918751 RepID=UPI00201B4183|nr:SDR family oxidoreductase [Aestuariirhabdus haliotis]MCL6414249.1 SDR family oxidoreductase [Aestuariirhabdus haliotis]MCL6418181.1 SDR family oxidoreductase [Aestuariirhabdus haliotis]
MSQRTLLVTGASRGIGRAIIETLADDFSQVVVHFAHDPEPAQQLCSLLQQRNVKALALCADISDEQQVLALFDQTQHHFGDIHAVVQNAGVNSNGLIATTDLALAEFQRLHRINGQGAFLVLREAARRVVNNGRIIALSTTVNRIHSPGYGGYATSKGVVDHLVPILAKELAAKGITVNAVAPSAVDTELFRQGKSDQVIEAIAGAQPMGRLGKPDDIVPIVQFLACEHSGWISGQIIGANGALA